jgi:glycine/D-amino acid oxidase-like deaminating enzyme/nitrite reductase/ring-hydroxylating ferredoxin subunit
MATSTESIWATETHTPATGSLGADVTCDVCIVGAGMAGLTLAYELSHTGRNIVVLDAQPHTARGESAHTSAHLSDFIDDGFDHVRSTRGEEAVRLAYESHRDAITRIETIARVESIDCGFLRVDGYLVPGADEKGTAIDDEERVCRAAGIPVERGSGTIPGTGYAADRFLKFPNQAQFQPLAYLAGLAKVCRNRGVFLFTETRVVQASNGRPHELLLQNGFKVKAASVVLATNTPLNGGLRVNMRLAAYTTYVLAAELPAGAVRPGLVWDTEDPYHYVRTQRQKDGSEWLIVGGEDHKTGQADDQTERWGRLEHWMRRKFPMAGAVRYRWDGQVFETPDGLGLIGADPEGGEGSFIATGDSGMGLTHSTIAGMMLADLIAGKDHKWRDLYSPSRLPLMAARTLLGENLNMVGQMTDWVTPGESSPKGGLAPGCGAVVRRGLGKVATYANAEGEVCELSAVCPHMGGIVHWNAADSTWDCPLHGSRFAADGQLIHGPATKDLRPIAEAAPTPATT